MFKVMTVQNKGELTTSPWSSGYHSIPPQSHDYNFQFFLQSQWGSQQKVRSHDHMRFLLNDLGGPHVTTETERRRIAVTKQHGYVISHFPIILIRNKNFNLNCHCTRVLPVPAVSV